MFKYIFKILLFFVAINCSTDLCIAQDNSIVNEYKEKFKSFNKDISNQFTDFKTKNDSVFKSFLDSTWTEFKLFYNEKRFKPKPKKQPVISIEIEGNYKKIPVKETQSIFDTITFHYRGNNLSKDINIDDFGSELDFGFYGTELNFNYKSGELPLLGNITKEGVSNFFSDLALSVSIDYIIYNLALKAKSLRLNDWGFVLLLRKASKKIYTSDNNQVLFVWYSLLKSGYDVKAGISRNNIYLLINSLQSIYDTWYFNLDDKTYYLIHFEKVPLEISSIVTHEAEYPGSNSPISFAIINTPVFEENPVVRSFTFREKAFDIELNKNFINYLNDFPNLDFTVYFNTNLSANTIKSFRNYFDELLTDKNELETVDILLEFIQYSLAYKTDIEQFGFEKYMFAEEALYFPFADCEDRAVLLSQLISLFTNLPVIGLNYPDHVTVAVAFINFDKGDFIEYKGQKYFVCDPTYVGAKSGMMISELRNISPKIIQNGK